MSVTGEIKNLYSDKDKTKVLLPRTKTKAVSDENGVGLDAILEDKASKSFVTNKIAEAQLGGGDGGDIDLSGFATKDDIATLNNAIKAIDYPVDSVNGKTGNITLNASDVGASPVITGAVSNLVSDNLNANIVPISNASGKLVSSDVTATELGYLGGVTSKIQTQLDNKQALIGIGMYTGDLNDYEKLRDTVAWVNGNSVTNSPTTNYAVVETWSHGGGIILQRITTVSHNVALRVRYNGNWNEWGWINPPMNTGTEYRLIERWNGKVVYCKVVSCGALPAAGNRKLVSIGLGITSIVGHCGYAVYGSSAGEAYNGTPVSFPIYGGTGIIGYHVVAAEGQIYIECIGDGTEFTSSYIAVWYTKD